MEESPKDRQQDSSDGNGAQPPHAAANSSPHDKPTQLTLFSSEVEALPANAEVPPTFAAAPADPPWSMGDIFSFIVFAFLSFIGANFAGISIFYVLRALFGWHLTLDQAFGQPYWVVGMQTLWEVLWLFFIYQVICWKYRRGFWEGLKWHRLSGSWPLFLVSGAAVAFVAQFVMNLIPSQKHLPIEKLFTSQTAGYLLAIFGVCIAPFIEELVFRGFFYPVFEKLWGMGVAVVLTALLFAAIHVPQLSGGWAEIVSIFVVGIIFSYCRGVTGSLMPSYLMHLGYNGSLFLSLYFTSDHFRSLKG